MELKVSKERTSEDWRDQTGIYVRAQLPDGKWVNADILQLTPQSLTEWLRSRGGDNPWAESVVLSLLGWSYEERDELREEEADGGPQRGGETDPPGAEQSPVPSSGEPEGPVPGGVRGPESQGNGPHPGDGGRG